ncbi:MAG: nucleoside triphosphate pyrophosphohydrolase [Bacteroidetes bacterium GWF2_49_14]|nr:MAG: nucleoside triphosphate pyrophosphohydrolase [Bacteroidetes bacterium GWF2_49_14]HBB93616.1 nucleoside triphosphate pyrophosphohydrolase [Bacteroidales bacterium]
MTNREEVLQSFRRLLEIMDELREKCPWDREQTLASLRTLTIEETYELADAILDEDLDGIREELGDILLHIVFYAKIGDEKGGFTIREVIDGINKKLVFRHPHIFGNITVQDAREVEQNWEKIKLTEHQGKTVLGGIPASLPAMIKAYRIQDKARGVGFDWSHRDQVWDKVEEEIGELRSEVGTMDSQERIESEFGDVLFSLINAARLFGINPENALEKTNLKFIRRFNYLEQETIKKGISLKELPIEEMDRYWNEAKKSES